GRRRRHHEQVGVARELDVAHLAFVGQREHVAVDAVLAQCLQREGRDELGAGLGKHAAHRRTAFTQAADELERFERRNAPCDDQQNPLALEHGSPAYHNTRLAKVYSPVSNKAQNTARRNCSTDRRRRICWPTHMPASAGTTAAAETMARGPSKRPKFSSEK